MQSQGTCSIIGHEIKGCIDLTWRSHVCRMTEIGDDFLLVITTERIERVCHVILRGEEVDSMLPELFDTGDAAANWFLVIASLHYQANMRIATDADVGLLEQIHHFVSMHFVISCQRSTMAGGNTPMVALAYSLDGQVLQRAAQWIVRIIHQHVNIFVVAFCQFEAEVDM